MSRIFAQISMGVITVFLALMWRYALILPILWPFFIIAASPIAWYVTFDRHLEMPEGEIVARLEMIANAVRETSGKSATELAFRR